MKRNSCRANAKLANILFTAELHHRFHTAGISTAALHPGGVATNFAAEAASPMRLAYRSFLKRFMLTPEQGADTLVWLATAVPGKDWTFGGCSAKRKLSKANKQAYDAAWPASCGSTAPRWRLDPRT